MPRCGWWNDWGNDRRSPAHQSFGVIVREAGMNEVRARGALVGGWRLVFWENRAADGQVTYPMGTDASATCSTPPTAASR